MVSPELLRRYPFFALLTDDQLKAVSLIAAEKSIAKGTIILKENNPAVKLYVLVEGDIDLIFSGGGEGAITNALVGSIAPGESLGVSSLIEPFSTSRRRAPRWTARSSRSMGWPCAPCWKWTRSSATP
jgi:signal-transduction protein with cAMP-binding, CBS, and nucleotidyltransferase domain